MATLSWCVLLMVIGCQVYDAASEITLTPNPATGSVAENAQVGATVNTLTSSDKNVTFTLESQVPATDPKMFTVGGTSGVVTVADNTHLDYESVQSYTLVIKATQTTVTSPESGNTNVTVTVTDVNEPPKFAEAKYTACVNTSSSGGTVVKQVTAADEDAGDVQFTYSLDDESIFVVDSTGTIKVKSDQTIGETPASYNLALKAADDDSTAPLTGTTTVSIDVAKPCPAAISPPATTPPIGDNTTLPGVTPAPNFATTITASFCLCLLSGAVHHLRIW